MHPLQAKAQDLIHALAYDPFNMQPVTIAVGVGVTTSTIKRWARGVGGISEASYWRLYYFHRRAQDMITAKQLEALLTPKASTYVMPAEQLQKVITENKTAVIAETEKETFFHLSTTLGGSPGRLYAVPRERLQTTPDLGRGIIDSPLNAGLQEALRWIKKPQPPHPQL